MAWLSSFGRGRNDDSSRSDGFQPEGKEILRMQSEGGGYMPVSQRAGGTWHYGRAVAQAYERVVYAMKAVDQIAADAAGMTVGKKKTPKMLEPVDSNFPLAELLNGDANPEESALIFRHRLSQHILLSKMGAFVHTPRTRGGEIIELQLLPPGRTRPVDIKKGPNAGRLSHYEMASLDPLEPPKRFDPEDVRWIHAPHPEKWRSMTPLESLGLTVELDYFARLFARSSVLNSGRPGMLVGVGDGTEKLDDGELRRLERTFSGGPQNAGRILAVGGRLSTVDLSRTLNEVGYQQTRADAKTEILTAFGVPESRIGNSSDRTFSNAGNETINYKTGTLWNHCQLQASAFHRDVPNGYFGFAFDEDPDIALAQSIAAEKAQAEWDKGLITVDEYREKTGKEPLDRPGSRVLWVKNSGVLPVGPEEDELALGSKMKTEEDYANDAAMAANLPGQADPNADPNAAPDPNAPPDDGGGGGADPEQALDGALTELQSLAGKQGPPPFDLKSFGEAEPGDAEGDQLGDALLALCVRRTSIATTRLESVRARRGTRFWEPAGEGEVNLDWVLNEQSWLDEAKTLAEPFAEMAARAALDGMADDAGETKVDTSTLVDIAAVRAGVFVAVNTVQTYVAQFRHFVEGELAAAKGYADLVGKLAGIRSHPTTKTTLIRGGAHRATAVAAEEQAASRSSILRATVGRIFERTWITRGDDKVRETHRAAHGQVRPVGERFQVGDALLRYPGDPEGPPGEVINCRCRLRTRLRRS